MLRREGGKEGGEKMDGCLEEGRQGNEGVGQKEELINGGKRGK